MSDAPNTREQDEVLKLFDQEERSYLRRLLDMFKGLAAPRDSLTYKEAIKELQRQWAPLLGIALPVLACLIMCSVSIGSSQVKPPEIEVTVVEPTQAETLEEVEPPPPPEDLDVETDIVDSFVTDMPSPPLGEVTADTPTPNPPVMMTPPTKVMMKGITTRGSGGGGIGGGTRLEGDMVGMFIDLSRDAKGNQRPEYGKMSKDALLHKDVLYMLQKDFGREAFAPYQVVPQRVYMSHLLLPYVKSAIGPETYKVDKRVKKGTPWVAVYKGQLQPEESGTYRLAGFYDDILVVRVNGKEVLEFTWDSRNNGCGTPTKIKSGWTQKDPSVAGKHKMRGFQNTPLTYGDWFELNENKPVSIEILIGDNGGEGEGGLTGGLLLVEKKGATYAKTPDGIPLLPPLCTTRLTVNERQRLEALADPTNSKTSGHYAFAAKSVPVMNTCGKKAKKLTQGDIDIDIGDL